MAMLLLAQNAVVCALFATFVAWQQPNSSTAAAPTVGEKTAQTWGNVGDWPALWRFGAVAVIYTLMYITAGRLVLPFVEAFYSTRYLPSLTTVIPLQLFVRGPMLALLVALVVRMVRGSQRAGALSAGAVLSVLGGIAPLVVPNPFLPDSVRMAHLIEVGFSNFVFGMLAAWVLTGGRRVQGGESKSAATYSRVN